MADFNILARMPSPRGKSSSLRFRGKGIDGFLKEFNHFATHANLTDDVKCEELRLYFLQDQLKSLYTSSEDIKYYRPSRLLSYCVVPGGEERSVRVRQS